MEHPDYKIVPARYCSGGQMVVQPTKSGTGYKTRACYLADNMGNWVHCQRGYVMSASKAELFVELYAEGWDGALRILSEGPAFYPPAATRLSTSKVLGIRGVKAYRRNAAAYQLGLEAGRKQREANVAR